MLFKSLKFISTIVLLTINISCVNKKLVNGQLPSAETLSTLKIGSDNKNLVKKILGHPSFEDNVGDNSIYYILSIREQLAFLDPELIDQKILQLRFNESNILQNIYFYNKDDAKKVAMSSNFTKTTGRKIGFLEQLISNFGVPGLGGSRQIIGSGKTK